MKNLIIIGARGFGREVHDSSKMCRGYDSIFSIKGFLDDKSDALDGFVGYPPILDSVEHYVPQEDDVFIVALGDGVYRKKYGDMIEAKGGELINLVHQQSIVSEHAHIGKGCIILRQVSISNDVNIRRGRP